jgi:choline dehydrogenase-like flavoprotein
MAHYDVIIIGTGAGGGTLARHLAPSGKRVLLLERGGWLPREPQNVSAEEVFVNGRYVSTDMWRYANGEVFHPEVHYFVGGATKMYGAALYRLRAEDFGELRHHDGISPAWPIGYEEMEPYYTLAERYYQVHGARGEDPTEPPSSAPYPFPAVSHEPRIQKLADDFAAHGHHPFHAPCGVMLDEQNMPFSACMRCNNCDGFPCIVHAKSDADVLGVRPAIEHANVDLWIESEAVRLDTNADGTAVTGVTVDRAGEAETVTGDIVVVSCGAANSARLLLMSATDKHPAGLANGSDQVGRNYMFHNSQAVLALSREENPTIFQKTLGINDFYFSGPDFDFPMGNIQMVGKSQAPMFRGEKPGETALAPSWTLRSVARHAIDFWLSTEDLPGPDNRVTVDEQGTITIAYTASNDEPKKRLYNQLKSMLGELDMHHHLLNHDAYLKNEIPVAGCAHQAGTVRFGSDPSTSVLDANCKAHELDNLYVVDTSFFPSIGAVNPALTAMANAVRVGDHLLERIGATVPSADATAVGS